MKILILYFLGIVSTSVGPIVFEGSLKQRAKSNFPAVAAVSVFFPIVFFPITGYFDE